MTFCRRGALPRLLLLALGALAVLWFAPPASGLVGTGDSPGICGYEPRLRAAVEEALGIHWSRCDEVTDADLAGIGELDLSFRSLTGLAPSKSYLAGVELGFGRFAPDLDQFTGFDPFLVVDLRGHDLDVGDIDPASIPLCFDGDELVYEPPCDDDEAVSYTLMLDGGQDYNGLVESRYTATEGGVVLVSLSWANRPEQQDVAAARRIDGAGELYFGHRIYSEQDDASQRDDAEYERWIITRSSDSLGALYVGAIPVHDDDVIESQARRADSIEITHLVVADDRAELGKLEPARADALFAADTAPLHDYVGDYVRNLRARSEADLIVIDDDSPTTPVCARSILDYLEEALDESRCRDISRGDLATLAEFDLSDQEISSLAAGDLDGLTGIMSLDLSGNELSTLPRGIFDELGIGIIAGYPEVLEQEVLIDLRGNTGGTGQGFFHTDLPDYVLADLKEHQRIALDTGAGFDSGFDRATYEVAEGGTLVFLVSLDDVDRPAIEFEVLASDTAEDDPDSAEESFDLPGLAEGRSRPETYRLYGAGDRDSRFSGTYAFAVDIPTETIDDGRDDTFTMRLASRNGTGSTLASARVTIREDGAVQPPPVGPTPPAFGTWLVEDSDFIVDDSGQNQTLAHNVPRLSATVAGQRLTADFMGHYDRTGGLARWGLPTSEVLVVEPNALTQYYQRGVVDFHRRDDLGGIWVIERRLAWDYFGGGAGGSQDLGVEPGTSNPNPGTPHGPWGHKVSDYAVDGTLTGFAQFFQDLGGVDAFGFPKTEARTDSNRPGTLHIATKTTGFIRQYFQAAVFEYHPGVPAAPIQLGLLGDDLRNLQFPNAAFANIPAFQAADKLIRGSFYSPPAVGTVALADSPAPTVVG